MRPRKMTPMMVVERVEPSMAFWVDRLGFEKVAEVPEGEGIGFALLVKDGIEVMLQSLAGAEKEVPGLFSAGGTCLYLEVDDLDPVRPAVRGLEEVVPEKTTFYGKREIAVREPGGHIVIFAADAPKGRP